MRKDWTVEKREVKVREPYGGTWIRYVVNITLNQNGHIQKVTVTDPDGIEHTTKDVQ